MKHLVALLLLSLAWVFPASAQLPPPSGLVVNNTPVSGGSTGECLYKKSDGRLGAQACSTGSVTTFSAGTTGFTPNSPTSGAVTLAGVLIGANGGTGVANTGKTITLGGNLATSGAFASTFTMTNTTTVTFPTTGTLATLAGSEALTNKTYNGNTWTAGTGVLTIAAAKTLTASNTLTFAGTDGSTLNIGTGGTLGTAAYVTLGTDVGTWLATPSSANLRAALTDETGGGAAVFADSPTLTGTAVLAGATWSGLLAPVGDVAQNLGGPGNRIATLYTYNAELTNFVTIGGASLTLTTGEVGLAKIAASGSAPGAAGGKVALVCGTNAGSAKLIAYAGTSNTPVTVVDNIGSGVSGC